MAAVVGGLAADVPRHQLAVHLQVALHRGVQRITLVQHVQQVAAKQQQPLLVRRVAHQRSRVVVVLPLFVDGRLVLTVGQRAADGHGHRQLVVLSVGTRHPPLQQLRVGHVAVGTALAALSVGHVAHHLGVDIGCRRLVVPLVHLFTHQYDAFPFGLTQSLRQSFSLPGMVPQAHNSVMSFLHLSCY